MQYIENESSFSNSEKDIIRTLKSIQEEIEATDFYYQRWCVADNKEIKDILFHNMLEEIEHTNMLMGFLNNVLPLFPLLKELNNNFITFFLFNVIPLDISLSVAFTNCFSSVITSIKSSPSNFIFLAFNSFTNSS